LNGEKAFVPCADGADTILVYAAGKDAGTEAFLVPSDNPGLKVGEKEKLMGLKALPTFRVTLDDCKLPESAQLGEGLGLQIDALLARSNVALAALAVGIGRAALEYARDYAKERVAFNEPIASRQSIAFMLAEMAIEVDATRLMTWEVAWLLDQGEDATEASVLARHYADEMALQVADSAVQVLGGHGYIREHPVELWLRNARGFSAMDGMAIL
jgi:alkylation response protein AidB-like acyl-CoA dehydrogenase